MSCVVCLGTRAGLTRAEHSAHGMAVLLLSVAARALDPRHPRMLTRCCACVAKSLARKDLVAIVCRCYRDFIDGDASDGDASAAD